MPKMPIAALDSAAATSLKQTLARLKSRIEQKVGPKVPIPPVAEALEKAKESKKWR